MALQDSNPDRRNLVATSVAFIAYYYGGGQFSGESINLMVMSLKFSEPCVLAFMAWFALFWFLYRYWLNNKGLYKEKYNPIYYGSYDNKYFRRYLEKKAGIRLAVLNEKQGYLFSKLTRRKSKVYLAYRHANMITWNQETGKVESSAGTVNQDKCDVPLEGLKGYLLRVYYLLECNFHHPFFSDYIVPYLLFLLVVSGWVYRFLWQ